MSELPPDPARLRLILQYLEEAVAENATVHVYLDIQRNMVIDALKAAEGEKGGTSPAPTAPANRKAKTTSGFKIDRARTPNGPVPTSVHLGDCHMVSSLSRSMSAHEARAALVDEQLEECVFCRPGALLGVDIDT